MPRTVLVTLSLLLTLALIACGGTPTPPDEEPTAQMCDDPGDEPIVDAALAEAIREALGVASGPTCADLAGLEELQAAGRGIASLDGLEHASSLATLNVSSNDITSAAPLAELASLRSVSLSVNALTDVTPLAGLVDLTGLGLRRNAISDIGPLAGLVNLEGLSLHDNQVSDLTPLAGMTAMRTLGVSNNPVPSIAALRAMDALIELGAGGLAPELSDIGPLEGKALVYLNLNGNAGIADLAPLAGLTSLETLLLGNTGITDLGLLAGMTGLRRLQLWGNDGMSDLAPLAGRDLIELDIGGTGVRDLSAVHAMTNLTVLYAYGLGLRDGDIDFIRDLAALERLWLQDNAITSLDAIVANAALGAGRQVDVRDNCLDLTPGSQARAHIDALLARGTTLAYEPQRACGPAVVVTVAAGAVGMELVLVQAAAQRYMDANPGVTVTVLDTPDLTGDRLGFYRGVLEAASTEVDVFQIDVTWVGDLAEHFVDLAEYGAAGVVGEHFSAISENNTVAGELIAIPWFADAGLLYYRTDLLTTYGYDGPPSTWSELIAMAQTIQDGERAAGNDDFWGFVWQGNAYEGLTANALEWIASNAGGSVVSPAGVITVDNPNAVAMLDLAASWVGTISPGEVTGFAEESARSVWQAGNAAFMRNWPYAYGLGQADGSVIAGLFDVAPLPAGDAPGARPAAALGGWQLAVSRYSDDPEAAADVALFLASYEEQKTRAIAGGFAPTIVALYEDADVLAAMPIAASFEEVLLDAVARPSTVTTPHYGQVSNAFSTAVHAVLTGTQDAATALAQLASDLEAITGLPTGAP